MKKVQPASDTEDIIARLNENLKVIEFLKTQSCVFTRVAGLLAEGFRNGKKILLFGNGGSAADAQHIACEFSGKFMKERRGLPAVALSANTSSLTAIGNDFGFEHVFARQVEACGLPGDTAVGLSTSGNSRNVIEAVKKARSMGIFTVGLSGGDGGALKEESDVSIVVPWKETPLVQEAHTVIGHIICWLVERSMFGRD